MSAELDFNASNVAPSTPFEPVPANWYLAHIIASEVKKTKDGKGRYLELTEEILDGPSKGRKVWDRLNIDNQNRQTVEIAQRQLSAICHCTGVMQLKNSAQLHNIPVMVKVSIKGGDQGPQNEVKSYKPAPGVAAIPFPKSGNTAIGAQQASAIAPATTARDVPPWAKKAG